MLPSDFKSLMKLNLLKSRIVFVLTGLIKIFFPLLVEPCQLSVSLLNGVLGIAALSFCLRLLSLLSFLDVDTDFDVVFTGAFFHNA